MATGRKRGSEGGSKSDEFSLGDLVLAKIKGFSAWPAKISRPEDFKQAPDPKKYLVQFFGTSEIAFISPGDIQEFTDETKSKLSARCQGKTVKNFAKAVKEICEAFEALQQKNLNGNNTLNLSSIHTADSMGDKTSEGAKDDEISKEGAEFKLETNNSNGVDSVQLNGSENQDLMACSSDDEGHRLPPDISSEKINELSSNPEKPTKKDSLVVLCSSPVKTGALHDKKVEDGSLNICAKESTIQPQLKSGQGQKRKHEEIKHKKRASQENSRDKRQTRFAPASNVSDFSMDGMMLALPVVSERDRKKFLDKKARSDARANARKDYKGKDEEHHDKVIPKKMKNTLKGHKKGDSKAGSPSKASKRINSRNEEPGHSYDEDGLPQAKRRCKEHDRPRTPSLQDDKMGNLDAEKNELLQPDKGGSPVMQLPKKRRLVRLGDDKLSKTPVHGGIANKVSSINQMPEPKKQTVVRGESHPHQRVFRNSGTVNETFRKQAPPIRSNKASSNCQNGVQKRTCDPSTELKSSGAHSERLPTTNTKLNKVSPKRSPRSTGGASLEVPKKISSKVPKIVPQKKVLEVANMKNLISTAQERKRQASLQNSSPKPKPPSQSINSLQTDVKMMSPFDIRQLSSSNRREIDESEERRVSRNYLSGSTDAVVARDAFEGIIETMSRRNRESILRATRHAIDCAKYGIANEIVDLLIRKLENEPDLHRKVDILFLVDSITKQSHSKKGTADASYIPSVEAALPRLIAAAAPPGLGAQENRHQCNKVLRLWLERKVFPEHVIRKQMNDIAAANNDDISHLLPRRCPTRAERAFDDPVLEMEGMLVDEYGSNDAFHLSGLLPSHMFLDQEEDDNNPPKNLIDEVADTSLFEQTPAGRDTSNHTVTPNDRHHHILEDVDRELEMEDDSVQHSEKALPPTIVASSESNLELVSNVSEPLPSHEGSPQPPLDTPPETPPLPSSPYSLPLPPPPPPPLSSPALSRPPKPLPPPPPLPSSQHHSYTHRPPSPYLSQPQVPPQVAVIPQQRPPLPISPPVPYRPPLPHEASNMPSGTQLHGTPIAPVRGEVFSRNQALFLSPAVVSTPQERVVPNTSRPMEYVQGDSYGNFHASQQRPPHLPVGASNNTSRPMEYGQGDSYGSFHASQQRPPHLPVVASNNTSRPMEYGQGDSYGNFHASQQRPPHLPVVASNNTSRPMEYGQGDPYGNFQASQQRPPHLPVVAPFGQRPLRHETPPQRAPTHFSYRNAAPQHQHPAHTLPNLPNGPRTFVNNDQWRAQGNEGWVSGARSGYFGTPQERPMSAAVNFHHSAANGNFQVLR